MVKGKTKSEENQGQDVSSMVEESQKTEEFVGGEELTGKPPKKIFLVEKISPESEPPVTQTGELVCPFCSSKNVRPLEAEDEIKASLAGKPTGKPESSKTGGEILPEAAKTEQEPAGQVRETMEPVSGQVQGVVPETANVVTSPPTPVPQETSRPEVVGPDNASKAGLST